MATTPDTGMLEPDQLREVDRTLLNFLSDGRVTPAYCQRRLVDEHDQEYSRGYVQERLARLVEHSHAENLHDCGLYELTDDPREGNA